MANPTLPDTEINRMHAPTGQNTILCSSILDAIGLKIGGVTLDVGGTVDSTARTAAAAAQTTANAAVPSSALGATVATLSGGKVPSGQLPSYVDDVVEAANFAALPGTGETGKIYSVLDTNKLYRWSGSAYVLISDTPTLASQAEAEAGTDNAKLMTALRVAQAIAALAGSGTVTAQRTIGKFIPGTAATQASATITPAGPDLNDGETLIFTGGFGAGFTFELDFANDGVAMGNNALVPSSLSIGDVLIAFIAALPSISGGGLSGSWDGTSLTITSQYAGAAYGFTLTGSGNSAVLNMSGTGTDVGADTGATYRKILNAPGAGKQWRALAVRCVVAGGFANQWTTAALALVAKDGGGTLYPICLLDASTVTLGAGTGNALERRASAQDYDNGLENCEIGIATVDPSSPATLLAEPVGDDLKVVVDAVPTAFPNAEPA